MSGEQDKDQTITYPRIGIDLGGTKIEIIVMDNVGAIIFRERSETPQNDYKETIRTISDLVSKTSQDQGLPLNTPIGICTPGAISLKTGKLMNSNSVCLNGQPVLQDLETISKRKVRIANDADCFTLSEASDGAAADGQTVAGIILGTGVGGGFVINNELNIGVNAISGEWGHIPLSLGAYQGEQNFLNLKNNRDCFCGRQNCIETWLAGPSLERSYFETFNIKRKANEISELADTGDQNTQGFLQEYCNLLALGLSNIINIIDPEVLVLGGGLSNMDILYRELPKYLPPYVFSDQLNTRIVKAKFGDSSGVRGAAWLWPAINKNTHANNNNNNNSEH